MTELDQFKEIIDRDYPMLNNSLNESLDQGGERILHFAEDILTQYKALAKDDLSTLASAFSKMVMQRNKLQIKYEIKGEYEKQSFSEAKTNIYDNMEEMTGYMLGLVCSQFAWRNHFILWCFYEDKFVSALKNPARVLEIAPGHGLLGMKVLQYFPNAILTGIDISPASIKLSQGIAKHCNLRNATYVEGDAMDLSEDLTGQFDAVICGELLEHVPCPEKILTSVRKALANDGRAYITAAITAPAPDHIYEFESVEEVSNMIEGAGLKIMDQICSETRAMTKQAKGAPRTVSYIVK